ncbi:MAG: hypothetical protein ABIE47_17460, partial [Pseudomonadota bacterium]
HAQDYVFRVHRFVAGKRNMRFAALRFWSLDDARVVSESLLAALKANSSAPSHQEQIGLIRFYLSCLDQ